MKSLTRVIMVDWYLFEQEEWDIRGHVSLLGKNGSGKSSFLDALQLVLLGGNKQDWNPNAKASDSSGERDIRSYALGIVKDEDAIKNSTAYQPRDSALTRIVLVFTDDVTGESCSIGACLTATRNTPKEEFEGFFILQDQELFLADLIEQRAGESFALPYDRLKAKFTSRSKYAINGDEENQDVFFFANKEPKKFVEQMLRSLGDPRHPPSPDKFRRAFKQSIKMNGIDGSVSDFVKTSILDEQVINLSTMRQMIESLDSKKKAVEEANEQIQKLEAIEKLFEQAISAAKRQAGYQWCAAELTVNQNELHIEELEDSLEQLAHDYSVAKRELNKREKALADLRDKLQTASNAHSTDNAQTQIDNLKRSKEGLLLNRRQIDARVEQDKETILYGAEVLKHREHIPEDLVSAIEGAMKPFTKGDSFWREEAHAIDTQIQSVKHLILGAMSGIQKERDPVMIRKNQIDGEISETESSIQELKEGRVPLNQDTQALIQVLAAKNIKAVPVCELVEVTDKQWQPAIEAYLKRNTQALVVDIDDTTDAIKIYRALKRDRHIEAKVVDGEKVSKFQLNIKPGTAPTLIQSEDSIAKGFIQNLLFDIELREDTASIRKAKRALADDGSFQSNAAFTKLKMPQYLMMGRGAAETQLHYFKQKLERLTIELREISLQEHSLDKAYQSLNEYRPNVQRINNFKQSIESLDQIDHEIRKIDQDISAIDTSHLEGLKQQILKLKGDVRNAERKKDNARDKKTESRANFRSKNKERRTLKELEQNLFESRSEAEASKYYEAQIASDLLDNVEGEFDLDTESSFSEAIKQCTTRANSAGQARQGRESEGHGLLGAYLTTYPDNELSGPVSSLEGYMAEVGLRLSKIKDIGLVNRENDVKKAFVELTHAIRSDLAIKLRTQISEMKRRFHELNRELRERPFSANQKYQFHFARIPEFQEFLNFVENVDNETVANVDSLFDETAHISAVIEQILEGSNGDELGDYRNYFTYDIRIEDTETGIEESFSKTKGKDSGGEYMTPFYVAMGASLAGAYRFQTVGDGTIERGLSLFPSDEAFKNMDYANTNQAAEYLKSIGLQLFVAAPDSAEPEFRSFVDTVLFFIKDKTNVTVSVDYVTPWAQNLIKNSFSGE